MNDALIKITLPVEEVSQKRLDESWDGMIELYIEEAWSNCNWMEYHGGYVIQDFETGEMYFLKIVD